MFWRNVLIRIKLSERNAWPPFLRDLAALDLEEDEEEDFGATLPLPLGDLVGMILRAWAEEVVLKARRVVIVESVVVAARRDVVVCIVRRLKSAGREIVEAIVVDGGLALCRFERQTNVG